MPVFSKLYNKLRDAIEINQPDKGEQLYCVYCSRKQRVTDFSQLKKGHHITVGGNKFMINIGDKQKSPYRHHAIVKEVQLLEGGTANVTLIHFFSTPFSHELEILETCEFLSLIYNEVYKVIYNQQPHKPEDIVKRAETLMKNHQSTKYSLLDCNCEHFCHWCSVGNERSFQVHNIGEFLKDIAAGVINVCGKIGKLVCKIIALSLDDITAASSAGTALVWTPWGLLGGAAIMMLIYTIFRHVQLGKKRDNGEMCACCCRRQRSVIWARFGAYCGLQIGGLALVSAIIAAGASTGVVGAAIAICGILTLSLSHMIPKMRKWFFSPFQGSKHKVLTLRNVWIGDVVSFDHRQISHEGIVSYVKIQPRSENKRGTLKVIHYSLPTLFGERKIIEKEIEVDLNNDRLVGHNYSGYKTHAPELVVKRARSRIGETKFGLLSNRSCHFCYWAKIDENTEQDADITVIPDKMMFLRSINPMESISGLQKVNVDHTRNRKHASKELGHDWARNRDEVKPGQIVSFKWPGFCNKAICTDVMFVKDTPSKLELKVVLYGAQRQRTLIEETFLIDLRYEDIWIYRYHPVYRYPTDEVIRRARARIGECKYRTLTNNSKHFVEDVVKKDKDEMVKALDEIEPGDAITFDYWGLKHDAVVTAVELEDSKANKVAQVTVIHYALDHIWSTRTIKEETIRMSLEKDIVYKKSYSGCVPYPKQKAVERARSRFGEQRFHAVKNQSRDFVHWAIVVQTPAIVEIVGKNGEGTSDKLLMPKVGGKVGMRSEHFDLHRVQTLSELKVGSIVEWTYYLIPHQGIVSEVDEKRGIIKVIHYGARHLFAKRTIVEEELPIDLNKTKIGIYLCNPKLCNERNVVLANAKARLGEQRWEAGNRSWEFCVACALIPIRFMFYRMHSWLELKLGSIIEWNYYNIPHQGIVSDVDKKGNTIKVIHYGTSHLFATRTIVEEVLTIDLRNDNLGIYRCDPTLSNKADAIVVNAKQRIGEQRWKKGNRSWDFCVACVVKQWTAENRKIVDDKEGKSTA